MRAVAQLVLLSTGKLENWDQFFWDQLNTCSFFGNSYTVAEHQEEESKRDDLTFRVTSERRTTCTIKGLGSVHRKDYNQEEDNQERDRQHQE